MPGWISGAGGKIRSLTGFSSEISSSSDAEMPETLAVMEDRTPGDRERWRRRGEDRSKMGDSKRCCGTRARARPLGRWPYWTAILFIIFLNSSDMDGMVESVVWKMFAVRRGVMFFYYCPNASNSYRPGNKKRRHSENIGIRWVWYNHVVQGGKMERKCLPMYWRCVCWHIFGVERRVFFSARAKRKILWRENFWWGKRNARCRCVTHAKQTIAISCCTLHRPGGVGSVCGGVDKNTWTDHQ